MEQEKYIDVDGVRTRYFEAGSGEPMVLIHGGNFGQSDNVDCAENWALNWPILSQSFHVFAIDKIGQGYTDNPADYTIEAITDHVGGFLRTLGLEGVHLVGHSRGGYMATRVTREDQDRIRTLIIVDSGTTSPGLNQFRGRLLAGAPKPLLTRESIAWVSVAFSHSDALLTPEWLDVREAIAKTPKNAEAVAAMNEAGEAKFAASLAKQKDETVDWIKDGNLKVPTMLVWGKNDPSAVLSKGMELFDTVAGSAPRSQMHIFNQAGHYCYREHPKDFANVVTAFVQGG